MRQATKLIAVIIVGLMGGILGGCNSQRAAYVGKWKTEEGYRMELKDNGTGQIDINNFTQIFNWTIDPNSGVQLTDVRAKRGAGQAFGKADHNVPTEILDGGRQLKWNGALFTRQ